MTIRFGTFVFGILSVLCFIEGSFTAGLLLGILTLFMYQLEK